MDLRCGRTGGDGTKNPIPVQISSDNWSHKTCKAPAKSSPPTNQHPTFNRLDALPVAQPTVSEP